MTIAEKADNYMRGRAMALSFKPLTLEDVKEAYIIGAEEQKHIDDAQFKEYLEKKKERLAVIERDPRSGMEYRIWHETNLLNEIINELFGE